MLSLPDRVRKRLEVTGKSARQASLEAGLGESYVKDILNGKSLAPAASALAKLARVLETTSSWLSEGTGAEGAVSIPVENYVGAGAVVLPIEDQGSIEYVECPPGADASGVLGAAIVKGTSQLPALRQGDVVFWGEGSNDASAFLGLECICTLEDGRVLVKRVISGSKPGLYTLLSHNDEPIEDVRLSSAAPVLWVKRSLRR